MGIGRLLNRKERRKAHASHKKVCPRHNLSYTGHCQACHAEGWMDYLYANINELWQVIEKNPNRVARGAR